MEGARACKFVRYDKKSTKVSLRSNKKFTGLSLVVVVVVVVIVDVVVVVFSVI